MQIRLNPAQYDFINSTKPNNGLVAGLGAGKSFVATLKCIMKKLQYPDLTVAYYLPNYGLIRDIAFDKFPTMLEDMGINYKLNKSDKELHIENAGKIIFRSMDNPHTIVGFEVFYSLIDECDILPMDKMEIAYNKILARNRQKADVQNMMDIVGTPEGFKFFYKRYVKDFNADKDCLIKSTTLANKHLPVNYIDTLRDQYPPNLLEAYLNGEFINLTSGAVYSYFDRKRHHTDETIQERESLHIGQDFNVGGNVSTIFVERNNRPLLLDIIISYNTQETIENIKDKYPNRDITIYPDASGASNHTNASKSDITLLREAGFRVNAPSANGRIEDRVNTVQLLLSKNEFLINCNTCNLVAEALEQQTYDNNGKPEKFGGAATVDDIADSLGYYLVRKFGINKIKADVSVHTFGR